MVIKKLKKFVLISALAIFPFGQIPSLLLTFINPAFHSIQIVDFLVFIYVVLSLAEKRAIFKGFIRSPLKPIALMFILSAILGFVFLNLWSVTALLYLVRIINYFFFGYILYKEKPLKEADLLKFIIVSAAVISTGGLLQYFFLPDTRQLYWLGWDDHYFRLISTFLDPAFTGIILVILFIFLTRNWTPKRFSTKAILLTLVFIAITLTYSRATYLSLFFGLLIAFVQKKSHIIIFLLSIVLFTCLLALLPRPSSEGVKLERTFSIVLRINNYKETIDIWKKSPVFGIGYNNLCQAKSDTQTKTIVSHSCSGSDNSLLTLLSTTGLVGFSLVAYYFFKFVKKITNKAVLGIFFAILIHSLFSNTIFYTHVIFSVCLFVSQKKLMD